jgi:hypothetical protein
MKSIIIIIAALSLCSSAFLSASDDSPEDLRAKHKDGSVKLSEDQDELSADVQQLILEQTVPQVIELLGQVEDIMGETTDKLAEADTGGDTMAAQTEIIEKIHAAAKKRQSEDGGGKSGGAMMDMMERMMGKKPEGQGKGKDGEPKNDGGGGGITGDSDSGNDAGGGKTDGKSEERRVPKAGGSAGQEIPSEFKKALDAYNRGVELKLK